MKLRSILLLAATAFIFSCNKKDKTASKTELITSGSWKITGIVSDNDANGTYETDDFAGMPSCFTDNYIVFASNGTVESNEGATKCDAMDPQSETFNWSFTNNEANLVLDGNSYTLLELSTSTLKIKEDLGGGVTTVLTMTKR